MRITDAYLKNSFLSSLSKTKGDLSKLQNKLSTNKNIEKPSDNPLSAGRIMRMNDQLASIKGFTDNIDNGSAFLAGTIDAMTSFQDEVQSVLTNMTAASNAANNENLAQFADKIHSSIETLVGFANRETNGIQLFGGSDSSGVPFSLSGGKVVENLPDMSGDLKIRIGKGAEQKINITGEELFKPVFSVSGNLDKNAATGSTSATSQKIMDADGNEYTFFQVFTKTAANTYQLNYDIKDTSGTSVGSGSKQLGFDAASGALTSVGGTNATKFSVTVPGKSLDTIVSLGSLKEGSSSTVVASDLSQKVNIFNVLTSVRDKYAAGQQPNDNQRKAIEAFSGHILNKLSVAGSVSNRLDDTKGLLEQQQLETTDLLSKERDTDVAKTIIDMQSQQYSLEMLYKVSSMTLPKSLLDYL